MTINDLAELIIELTGSSSVIEYAEERPGDVKHSMASIEKLLHTGFQPGSDFRAGLEKTVAFFTNHT